VDASGVPLISTIDQLSDISKIVSTDDAMLDDLEKKRRKIRASVVTSTTSLPEALVDEVGKVSTIDNVKVEEDEDKLLIATSNARGVLKDAVGAALEAFKIYDDVKDEVRLGDQGWKERYYNSKFGRSDAAFKRSVMRSYVEGLVWVFRYYYQGVASWKWYYPFHYAPFASDLVDLHSLGTISFELGRPFRPLDQLMAVLPALSSHALPPACAKLMSPVKERIEDDKGKTFSSFVSPVADFYPETFEQDPNGKRQSWLWVVLLPFIDEKRLVSAIDSVANTFSADERRRNEFGNEVLFVHSATALGTILALLAPSTGDVISLEQSTSGRPRTTPVTPIITSLENKVDETSGLSSAVTSSAIVKSEHGGEESKEIAEDEKVVAQLQREERAIVSNDASSAILQQESARSISSSASLLSPAISPAVTEALSLAQSEGEVISLRPDMGDPEHKGFTARIVRVARALKHGCAATLGGVLPSPFPASLPNITNVRVVQVGFLPPIRAVHSCKLLPGAQAPPNYLQPSDDASGKVPRLSRGHNIVDLAHSIGSIDRGDGGGSEWSGGGGGGDGLSGGGRISQFLAQANQNQQQRPFMGMQHQQYQQQYHQQSYQNPHQQQQYHQQQHHQQQQQQQQHHQPQQPQQPFHSHYPSMMPAANQHGMMFSQAPQLQAPFMHVGSALTGGMNLQMAYNQQTPYQQQPMMVPSMIMTSGGPMMMMVPSYQPPGIPQQGGNYQHMGMFPTSVGGGVGGNVRPAPSQRGGYLSGGGFVPGSTSNSTRYSFKRQI
jgi:hypothetical protein